jgi:hypothetical protein
MGLYEADPLVPLIKESHDDMLAVPDDIVFVVGYLGEAEEDGNDVVYKVYPDEELRAFIRIPEAAIKRRIQIDADDAFGARSALYLDGPIMRAPIDYGTGYASHLADFGLVGLELPSNLEHHAAIITLAEYASPKTTRNCSTPICAIAESDAAAAVAS